MKAWKVLAGIAVLVSGTTGITLACSASSPSPVYVCGDFNSCQNGQFLQVNDHNGSPVFAVGETGGAKTFGDCTSDYGPTDIFNAAVTLCYRAPSGSCKAPSVWVSPQGIFECAAGRWIRHAL